MKKTYIYNLATDGSECTMCWHPTESGASSELVASNSNKRYWWRFSQDEGSPGTVSAWNPLKSAGYTPEKVFRSACKQVKWKFS